MLLHFDTLISKVLFLFSIISLGNIKLKNHLQSLMKLMLDDLNSFIKKRVTAKSSDLTSSTTTVSVSPKVVQSIAMSMHVFCLSVCVSVCPLAYLHDHDRIRASRNFVFILHMAIAQSSSGVVAICYRLPVLWITSMFNVFIQLALRSIILLTFYLSVNCKSVQNSLQTCKSLQKLTTYWGVIVNF